MPNPLPTLRGSAQQALYPVTRVVSCMTKVSPMFNGSERRWVQRPPLYEFTLPMKSLNGTNKASWLALFNTVKGRLNTDLQLTLGSVTYSNLALMEDSLSATVDRPMFFDQQVRLRQVVAANFATYAPPSVGSTYPTLSFGAVAEYPFVQVSSFLTSVADNVYGPRFALPWYGAAVTNFPTTYLRNWRIQYPMLTDADLATLETFFLGKQGRYASFTFVDPLDSVSYGHVRFDSDAFTVLHQTVNQNMVTITLHQTFNS